MPPTWALNAVGHLLNSGPNSNSPLCAPAWTLTGCVSLSVCLRFNAHRTTKSLNAAKECLTVSEPKTEMTYSPPRTTSAATLRVTTAPRAPFSIIRLVFVLFFSRGVRRLLVTVSLVRRHRSRLCPRRLRGAPALGLAFVGPHKETHECLHGMGQG